MFDQQAADTYYHFATGFGVLMMVCGTLGSVLIFITAFQLRKTTTFVFLTFLSVTDALSLYWWNIDDFNYVYLNFSFQEESAIGCKIENYFQMVAQQSSAWLLVTNCFETTSICESVYFARFSF